MNNKIIDKINNKCPYDQGIFLEPYGIPDTIKELVIYYRAEIGGKSGGSCWGGEARYYTESNPDPMTVLDLYLQEVKPNITYLQYKRIEALIHSNDDTVWEYYGNQTDYVIKYIILSELDAFLETI